MVEVPGEFLNRMAGLLGDDFAAFEKSTRRAPVTGLRVNTLKVTPQEFIARAPFDLTPVPWCPAGFSVFDAAQPGKHPYHAAGLYYLQEPSAMLAAELLDPQPGEHILDLAAAPGGKATHLAALMQNTGLLVANEIHPRRAWDLAENLERCGVRNAAITNETPERLAKAFGGFFDGVLVDAPCSGEGMFRKSEAARRAWSPALVEGCARRQAGILETAVRLVRPGGRLVYTTCTFNPLENEGVLDIFLETHAEYTLVDPPRQAGGAPGRPDWLEKPTARAAQLVKTVRLWPHQIEGEGHFAALLQREESGVRSRVKIEDDPKIIGIVRQNYRDFCREALVSKDEEVRLQLVGSYLYQLPPGLPVLKGLRVIHPGWWLGVVKKNRFQPAHALALGLTCSEAQRVLNLDANGTEVRRYLHGDSLGNQGQDGWTLVGVDGFPIGWGKSVGGTLKNYYPRGLRWA
jgi:NOL1/NOP2/sun family putative RNA methylase